MGFVSPDAIVSPSPSIRNLVHDPAPKNVAPEPTPAVAEPAMVETRHGTSLPNTEPVAPAPEPVMVAPEPIPAATEPTPAAPEPTIVETRCSTSLQQQSPSQQQNDTPIQDVETPQQPASSPVENPENYFEKFKEQWDAMVDNVFSKVPTLLAPLKNYPLEVKNNVVYLKLRNSMQVDDFSIKKVAVLQYLRNHFDPNINDVEVSIDDKTELKKYILDEKDKIQELQHQNPDFAEFMQTLHLQSCN